MKKALITIATLCIITIPALAKNEPWTLYEELDIPSNTVIPKLGNYVLKGDRKYKIVVSGTYSAGDNIEADAMCSFRTGSSTEWTDSVSTYESYGPTLLDLMVNGESDWGTECRTDHTYTKIIDGDGAEPNFFIYDTYPSNNSGSLDVEVYEFWKPQKSLPSTCTTIQDGVIEYGRRGDPNTDVIPIGYDDWGYNYQAHLFNGYYHNSPRPSPPYTKDTIDDAPSKTWLIMKWSEAWLSNKDCDGDGKLDRGYACNPENPISSACDGAWVTNHQFGSYEKEGKTCYWNYFVKIVYINPENAEKYIDLEDDIQYWYTDDGEKIGSVIWGAYAKILQISNDPCAEEHGVLNNFETPAGFGFYK